MQSAGAGESLDASRLLTAVSTMCRSGNTAWRLQTTRSWTLNDTVVGSARQSGGLSFIKVKGAGHMVPMDQPPAALDMFTRFLRNDTYPGAAIPLQLPTAEAQPALGRLRRASAVF